MFLSPGISLLLPAMQAVQDMDLTPESRKIPGGGRAAQASIFAWKSHGRVAWRAIVHGVTRAGHS